MSNEVNISQLAYGTLEPGYAWEWYLPRPDYDAARNKVAFFTIVPDPLWGGIELPPGDFAVNRDMQIDRVWNTVWSRANQSGIDHVFQRNVRISNPGALASAYELLVAETDN